MKIRIKGNTVRFRLVKREVKQLSEQGYVEEITEFPNQNLVYRIESKENIPDLEVDFFGNKITMYIPQIEASQWNATDRITYKNSYKGLNLLLEKDFVCLDHTDEDQSDNYPNPNKHC